MTIEIEEVGMIVRDVRRDGTGRRKREGSGSSRRDDNDGEYSSAFTPVDRLKHSSVLRLSSINNAGDGNEYESSRMCGGVKLDV